MLYISAMWPRIVAVGLLVSAATVAWTAEPSKTVSLKSLRSRGSVDRVEVTLDASGDLLPSDEWKVEKLKMTATGTVCYDERSLEIPAGGKGPLRSIRHYDKVEAMNRVAADEAKPRLRDQRRLIGVEIDRTKAPKATMFSPRGTLTSEELELVDLTVDSLIAEQLLPDKPVAAGHTWKHPDEVIAAMWGLDRVSDNGMQSTLLSVQEAMARMEFAGKVQGTEHGVATTIELKGKYRFDMKLGRVTWLGMAFRQKRERSRVVPGLDVVARLQMTVEPLRRSEHLDDAAIQGLATVPSDDLLRIACEADDGSWQLAHDRIWVMWQRKRDAAVLRMADAQGDTLAQCKISQLPPAAKPGQEISLAEFQADIQRALDKSFGQFVEAGQTGNQADCRVSRVVIRGKVNDVPIRWIYYLLADKFGHRAVFVFDLKEEHADRFGHADQRLVNSFRFLDRKVASKPE